jgi:hypothetical protein
MSQTTSQYMDSLLSKYTPSASEFDAARGHRASIETRLDSWLGLHEMFETGSLKHGTGVWMYSDADYIVSLKGVRPTSDTALNKVKDALQDRFPQTAIQIRRPAVVCNFASGDEAVEVVPAYPADDSGYWITDPLGGWMKTHPKSHNNYVNEVNKKHSGGAKKLARLAKTWKYKCNVPVSSCYLEMRAARYADGVSSISLPIDLYDYFSQLHSIELAAMNDPTGLGSRFNAYSSESKKEAAMSKLSTAVTRAQKVKDYYIEGDQNLAIHYLKLLFNQ